MRPPAKNPGARQSVTEPKPAAVNTGMPSYARPTQASLARRPQATQQPHVSRETHTPKTPPTLSLRKTLLSPHSLSPKSRPAPKKRPRTGFFSLPAELRNCIYEYAMAIEERSVAASGQKHPPPILINLHKPSTLHPLLRVSNAKLYREWGSIYFAHRQILIYADAGRARLVQFLTNMGAANCRLLAANPGVLVQLRCRCAQCAHWLPTTFTLRRSPAESTRGRRWPPSPVRSDWRRRYASLMANGVQADGSMLLFGDAYTLLRRFE